jgi:hypothetical protein
MRPPSRYLVGGVLILTGVFLVVGSLALHSWGSRTVEAAGGIAPPLSADERSALVRDSSAVSNLPKALREVPYAMVDAARSKGVSPLSRTQAGELLFEHPELTPLLRAVEHPTAVADSLARGLGAPETAEVPLVPLGIALLFFVAPGVLAVALGATLRSRRLWSGAQRLAPALCLVAGLVVVIGTLVPIDNGVAPSKGITQGASQGANDVDASVLQGDLSQLEQVYDDIVPALQYAGAMGHQVLDPESAVQVLVDDPHLSDLNGFVTNFSKLYGVGVLVTQEAAGSDASPNASQAMRWLAWVGLLSAAVFLSLGAASLSWRRRRDAITSPERAADDELVFSTSLAESMQ